MLVCRTRRSTGGVPCLLFAFVLLRREPTAPSSCIGVERVVVHARTPWLWCCRRYDCPLVNTQMVSFFIRLCLRFEWNTASFTHVVLLPALCTERCLFRTRCARVILLFIKCISSVPSVAFVWHCDAVAPPQRDGDPWHK